MVRPLQVLLPQFFRSRRRRRPGGTAPSDLYRAILLGLLLWTGGSAHARTAVILTSDSLSSTTRCVAGLISSIKKSDPDLQFVQIVCHTSNREHDHQITQARQAKPDIVVTVGSTATEHGLREFPSTPIVFASVLYPQLLQFIGPDQRQITGASLDIPFAIQFKHFKTIVPNLRQIGVVYSSGTESLVRKAAKIAADSGLQLIPYKLQSERDLPQAIDSLTGSSQGIWSLADPFVFTPQGTRYILVNTLRKGIPVMGFNRNVVESGALFALDFDYKAVGRQAGEMVIAILAGKPVDAIPVSAPDIIWFHYNEKTAGHLKISVPAELVAVAKEAYR